LTISDTHFAICASCLSVGFFIDEFAMDVAGIEIGRGNRHEGKIVPHTKAGVMPERRILL